MALAAVLLVLRGFVFFISLDLKVQVAGYWLYEDRVSVSVFF